MLSEEKAKQGLCCAAVYRQVLLNLAQTHTHSTAISTDSTLHSRPHTTLAAAGAEVGPVPPSLSAGALCVVPPICLRGNRGPGCAVHVAAAHL